MPGTKEIKRRIKSVKNTKKITKAMELVAASKMRRAVAATLSSRVYSLYSWDILTSLSDRLEDIQHPFFESAEVVRGDKTLLILITSNSSLCGGYNAQAIKRALSLLKTPEERASTDIISVGKKGDAAMRRIGGNVIATFTELGATITLQDIAPISRIITDSYKGGSYGKVVVVFTDFVSALLQKPTIKKLLPISKQDIKDLIEKEKETVAKQHAPSNPYLIEGDPNMLIELLAEKLVRTQIYQMLLESSASEQSARMVAMKNASEASGEMIDDLTLVFNKARQANITREISEISAGMASVE